MTSFVSVCVLKWNDRFPDLDSRGWWTGHTVQQIDDRKMLSIHLYIFIGACGSLLSRPSPGSESFVEPRSQATGMGDHFRKLSGLPQGHFVTPFFACFFIYYFFLSETRIIHNLYAKWWTINQLKHRLSKKYIINESSWTTASRACGDW